MIGAGRVRNKTAKRDYLGVYPQVYGVPLTVMHSGVDRQLELPASAIQQHLRPPTPDLYSQERRGRPALAARVGGREWSRIQDEGVRALGEEAEGDRGGEAGGEGLHPHPARARE